MALPVWPASLPHHPRRSTYRQIEAYRAASETEFEQGPNRARPNEATARIAYELSFTPAQFADFETFLKADLFHGTSRFTMPVVRIGRPEQIKTVRIEGGAYQPRLEGATVVVSFTLVVFNW